MGIGSSIFATTGIAAGSTQVPAPILEPDARDDAAKIWYGTGSAGATSGVFAIISFGNVYSSPFITYTPKMLAGFEGLNAYKSQLYIASTSVSQIVIGCASPPPANVVASSSGGLGITIHMDPSG
jgi:hypothetical protein